MTKEELDRILKRHKKWLTGDGGERADLRDADFRYANLSYADLRYANLRYADFRYANLRYANLSYADLREANFRYADLNYADLRYANFRYADFRDAGLSYADLRYADFRYADFRYVDLRDADFRYVDFTGTKGEIPMHVCPYNCPEFGSFVAFKKARASILDETGVIVQLQITENAKRCSATSRKCRCDEAIVLSITSLDGSKSYSSAVSKHDDYFIYKVGEKVRVDDFDDNRWNECSTGIHFFITRDEAVNY